VPAAAAAPAPEPREQAPLRAGAAPEEAA